MTDPDAPCEIEGCGKFQGDWIGPACVDVRCATERPVPSIYQLDPKCKKNREFTARVYQNLLKIAKERERMTDNPDVERLNRIRAALNKALEEEGFVGDYDYHYAKRFGFGKGILRALEIVERVWEPFYEGKSEDRGK